MKRTSKVLLGLLALFTIVAISPFLCTSIFFAEQSEAIYPHADTEPPLSSAVLVVITSRGSIWKFHDMNRECYFNSVGGIWCTD